MDIKEVVQFICEEAEIGDLQSVRDALRTRSKSAMGDFKKGDWIRFPYKGNTWAGRVARVNKKSISIVTASGMVGKIPPVIGTKMTKEEIVAARLKGSHIFCEGEIA